jgi:hypothetical protein
MASREPTEGLSIAEFDALRRRHVLSLFVQVERFMGLDNQINENFLRITTSIADYIAEHPEILKESASIRTGTREGAVEAGGFKGGAFSGGGVVDDILGTITDVLKEEKAFIQEIVKGLLPF